MPTTSPHPSLSGRNQASSSPSRRGPTDLINRPTVAMETNIKDLQLNSGLTVRDNVSPAFDSGSSDTTI